ncbi:MAG: CBS domain-containing protein [Candidatus Dormiibacterota bacterium]
MNSHAPIGKILPGRPRHRVVADVMTKHVHVAGPEAPFRTLVRLIEENRVGAIPIVDQRGVPIGIVSEADLMLNGNVASDVMTSPAITVAAESLVSEATRLMQNKTARHLVVVDQRGRIAGIVSRSNMLRG